MPKNTHNMLFKLIEKKPDDEQANDKLDLPSDTDPSDQANIELQELGNQNAPVLNVLSGPTTGSAERNAQIFQEIVKEQSHTGNVFNDHDPSTDNVSFFPATITKKDYYSELIGLLSSEWKANVLWNYSEAMDEIKDNDQDPSNDIFSYAYPKLLFDFYIPTGGVQSFNFLVWDSTCHLMQELCDNENHHVFDFYDPIGLAKIAKDAYEKAERDDLQPNVNANNTHQHQVLIGGIAIWNMLLPKRFGGSCPDVTYSRFLTHIRKQLGKFWDAEKEDIPERNILMAFLDFKELAIRYYKSELEATNRHQPTSFKYNA